MSIGLTRRAALTAGARVGAALWLSATADEILGAHSFRPGQNPLDPAERTDLDALTALIFPTDESPGAREAHVVRFIEGSLSTFAADQLPLFRSGLADLRARATRQRAQAKSFSELAPAVQESIVRQLDKARSPFFEAVRTATVLGMFSHPRHGGNAGKVGWKILGFEDRGAWQAPFGDYDRPGR